MTMILVAVDFDAPIALPGRKAVTTFPDPVAGWAGFAGWQMWIDHKGQRLYIASPPGEASLSKSAAAEADANGLAPKEAAWLVSVPLHRCVLRCIGPAFDTLGQADAVPSEKLTKVLLGDAPLAPAAAVIGAPSVGATVNLPAKKKPTPPAQNNAPQPLRRPPGAKPLVQPPISTEIEVDGQMPKSKRSVMPLESESQ